MRELVVVVGGLTTDRESLEGVAKAAVDEGLAKDAVTYTMPQAVKQPERLAWQLPEAVSMTHSFGSYPVRAALDGQIETGNRDLMPGVVVAANGYEPLSMYEMLKNALAKTRLARKNPEIDAMLRRNLADARKHPFGNAVPFLRNRRFSTFDSLAAYSTLGSRTLAVAMSGDEMTPYRPGSKPSCVDLLEFEGSHDELLLHPGPIMAAIARWLRDKEK